MLKYFMTRKRFAYLLATGVIFLTLIIVALGRQDFSISNSETLDTNATVSQSNNYYIQKAIHTKNPSLCEFLAVDPNNDVLTSKSELVASCLSEYAIQNKDIDVCSGIKSDEYSNALSRITCLDKLAKILNRVDICRMMPGDSSNNCLNQFTSAGSYPELCLEMSVFNERLECFSKQTKETLLNPNYCKNGKTPFISDECYDYIAVKSLDKNLCKNIFVNAEDPSSQVRYDLCVTRIDARIGRKETCTAITGNTRDAVYIRDICFLEAAFKLRDNTLCVNIENRYDKNHCIESIKNAKPPDDWNYQNSTWK